MANCGIALGGSTFFSKRSQWSENTRFCITEVLEGKISCEVKQRCLSAVLCDHRDADCLRLAVAHCDGDQEEAMANLRRVLTEEHGDVRKAIQRAEDMIPDRGKTVIDSALHAQHFADGRTLLAYAAAHGTKQQFDDLVDISRERVSGRA